MPKKSSFPCAVDPVKTSPDVSLILHRIGPVVSSSSEVLSKGKNSSILEHKRIAYLIQKYTDAVDALSSTYSYLSQFRNVQDVLSLKNDFIVEVENMLRNWGAPCGNLGFVYIVEALIYIREKYWDRKSTIPMADIYEGVASKFSEFTDQSKGYSRVERGIRHTIELMVDNPLSDFRDEFICEDGKPTNMEVLSVMKMLLIRKGY